MDRVNIVVLPDGRVTRRDAARYLGLSAKTLANRNGRGLGPHSLKVGGRRFYRLMELEAFVASGSTPSRALPAKAVS